ncbi:hypothetical protein VB780_15525 [Leptolyngbya sp. CCNP1308]|uniref:hypothetical protein n=1 Tax=Leptolyngbya sp. CCNP1308 TaxID=3110255 RepID=UPI002B1FAB52|nr:hypothetical protein [Leptolyngbya sp. CCNP1308]MEA5449990.1 hypothetical protein [Leptolyngbya sp. CCNP1308]
MLADVLLMLAVLSAGVVYGVDVFFAVVGRPALAASDEQAIANVMAHLHRVADARMPIFGALAVLSTAAVAATSPLGSLSSGLAIAALAGLLVQLGLYLRVAKPVNEAMKAATQQGTPLDNPRALQNRWDSVIVGRAIAMTWAMACLLAVGALP